MSLLYFFESVRAPVLDGFFSLITHFGEETLFIAFGLLLFWCVDKKEGYYLLCVGLLGTALNQLLKLLFRIPRPWVRDPDFTIVESARAGATGYSFPSGHTQSSIGVYGAIARWPSRRAVRIPCIALCFLVPLSRMYLGVHTPLDVGVSLGACAILVLLIDRLYRRIDSSPALMYAVLGAIAVTAGAFVLYTRLWPFPADVDAANLLSARENACSLLGAALGMNAAYFIDRRCINYDVSARWWVQIIKYALGLALLLAIKLLLKTPLNALLGETLGRMARYFLMLMFAGALWPATFRFFCRMGGKHA